MFKIDKVRSHVGLKHFSVPEEGFVVNIRIQDAMGIELNAFKINSVYEDCKKVLNESTNNISTLEALQKDPESYFYDYFGEIIRQVDLRREELKSKFDSYSDEIFNPYFSAPSKNKTFRNFF